MPPFEGRDLGAHAGDPLLDVDQRGGEDRVEGRTLRFVAHCVALQAEHLVEPGPSARQREEHLDRFPTCVGEPGGQPAEPLHERASRVAIVGLEPPASCEPVQLADRGHAHRWGSDRQGVHLPVEPGLRGERVFAQGLGDFEGRSRRGEQRVEVRVDVRAAPEERAVESRKVHRRDRQGHIGGGARLREGQHRARRALRRGEGRQRPQERADEADAQLALRRFEGPEKRERRRERVAGSLRGGGDARAAALHDQCDDRQQREETGTHGETSAR